MARSTSIAASFQIISAGFFLLITAQALGDIADSPTAPPAPNTVDPLRDATAGQAGSAGLDLKLNPSPSSALDPLSAQPPAAINAAGSGTPFSRLNSPTNELPGVGIAKQDVSSGDVGNGVEVGAPARPSAAAPTPGEHHQSDNSRNADAATSGDAPVAEAAPLRFTGTADGSSRIEIGLFSLAVVALVGLLWAIKPHVEPTKESE